jgi:hypothetical protein
LVTVNPLNVSKFTLLWGQFRGFRAEQWSHRPLNPYRTGGPHTLAVPRPGRGAYPLGGGVSSKGYPHYLPPYQTDWSIQTGLSSKPEQVCLPGAVAHPNPRCNPALPPTTPEAPSTPDPRGATHPLPPTHPRPQGVGVAYPKTDTGKPHTSYTRVRARNTTNYTVADEQRITL